eukprot:4342604-Amphidinium_carterae.1
MGSLEEPRAAIQGQGLYYSHDSCSDAPPPLAVQDGHDPRSVPPGHLRIGGLRTCSHLFAQSPRLCETRPRQRGAAPESCGA